MGLNASVERCLVVLAIITSIASTAKGAELTNQQPGQLFREYTQKYPRYNDHVLPMILAEANQVAEALGLTESLPISKEKLIEVFISPPSFAKSFGAVGNVTTSNYIYYCTYNMKFTSIVLRDLQQEYLRLPKEFLWPMSKVDTNAAYEAAVKILKKFPVDVEGLNRDCILHINYNTPEGLAGKHFVPIYWVYWRDKKDDDRTVVSIEFFGPTKHIHQLYVMDGKYNLRKPLKVDFDLGSVQK